MGVVGVLLAAACGAGTTSDGSPEVEPRGMPGEGSTTTPGASSPNADSKPPTSPGSAVGTSTGGASGVAGPVAGNSNAGGTGASVVPPIDPYEPRSGPFKMLVYSATNYYRHDGSITSGKELLQKIAVKTGYFTLEITETNDWLARIDDYELLFFLNPSGDIFNDQEEQIFEDWMRRRGAFVGTHSATDTENGWSFYSEVTGQFYNGHGPQNALDRINLEPEMLGHPALKSLPNPWQRYEEWKKFDQHQVWSAKPGFKILGRKQADGQPIMWIREWGNFRSFYTALGHDAAVFKDQEVEQHLTGGIMWAARREHLLP
jgi:hypothetical protein